jgi:hypothetical protein
MAPRDWMVLASAIATASEVETQSTQGAACRSACTGSGGGGGGGSILGDVWSSPGQTAWGGGKRRRWAWPRVGMRPQRAGAAAGGGRVYSSGCGRPRDAAAGVWPPARARAWGFWCEGRAARRAVGESVGARALRRALQRPRGGRGSGGGRGRRRRRAGAVAWGRSPPGRSFRAGRPGRCCGVGALSPWQIVQGGAAGQVLRRGGALPLADRSGRGGRVAVRGGWRRPGARARARRRLAVARCVVIGFARSCTQWRRNREDKAEALRRPQPVGARPGHGGRGRNRCRRGGEAAAAAARAGERQQWAVPRPRRAHARGTGTTGMPRSLASVSCCTSDIAGCPGASANVTRRSSWASSTWASRMAK